MNNQDPFVLASYLPYKLTVVAQKLSAGFSERYRERYGISIAEWRVLVHVADAGLVSIRDIHERVHLDKVAASRAASKLVEAGCLVKETNETDRRRIALTLTPKGDAMMKEILEIALQYQAKIEAVLGDEKDALYEALDQLLEADL